MVAETKGILAYHSSCDYSQWKEQYCSFLHFLLLQGFDNGYPPLRVQQHPQDFPVFETNAVSSYLALNAIQQAETYAKGMFWTRIIWDVVAVAWLLNEDEKFMCSEIRKIHLPNYQGYYENDDTGVDMRYIFDIQCDQLWRDVIDKITG